MDERVEWSLTRAALWGEVKDRLNTSAMGLSGGQQQRLCIARTIAMRPGGHPAGRADQRARPDQHAEDRGADRRAEARFHHRHRDPQHAAGGALRRSGGVLLSRRAGRGRRRRRRCSPRRSRSGRRNTSPAGSAESEQEARSMPTSAEHIVKSFEQELKRLRGMLIEMGGMVESQVAAAAAADRRRATATRPRGRWRRTRRSMRWSARSSSS